MQRQRKHPAGTLQYRSLHTALVGPAILPAHPCCPRKGSAQTSKSMALRWGASCSMQHVPQCLALMTHAAYRPTIWFSRTAACKSCASGRSQPCCRLWRSYMYVWRHACSRRRTAFRTKFVVAPVSKKRQLRVYLDALPAAHKEDSSILFRHSQW